MCRESKQWALELECLFRIGCLDSDGNRIISADSFSTEPYEELENGLSLFAARGIIKFDEINYWMEQVNFEKGENLNDYLRINGSDRLREFITCLKEVAKRFIGVE